MDKIAKVRKPEGTEEFWKDILQGGLGTTASHLLRPNFETILSMFPTLMRRYFVSHFRRISCARLFSDARRNCFICSRIHNIEI
jgi:hypothetical protein